MSGPIGINQQAYLNIEKEIETIAQTAERGEKVDPNSLTKAQNDIKQLLSNKNLPQNVKKHLNEALKQLKGAYQENGNVELSNLFKATYDVKQAASEPTPIEEPVTPLPNPVNPQVNPLPTSLNPEETPLPNPLNPPEPPNR